MQIKVHPILNNYEFNTDGQYRHVGKTEWKNGDITASGYKTAGLSGQTIKPANYKLHRAIWSCFNGPIPDKMVIDHLDNDRINNKLNNLDCVTTSENNCRSYERGGRNHCLNTIALQRFIKSKNIETNETKFFKSKSQASSYLGVLKASIFQSCKNPKCVVQKKYKFTYATDEELTQNQLTLIADPRIGRRKVLTEADRQRKKEKKDLTI